MKKQTALILIVLTAALLLTSCFPAAPGQPQVTVLTPSPAPSIVPAPTIAATAPATPTLSASPSPSPTPTVTPAAQNSCAYITGISMRNDGQTDIVFDFVDWLSGKEAEKKYKEDHPGASAQEIADAVEEIGYIRNVNKKLRTFHTSADTKYYLPDPDDLSTNVQVSYNNFRARMFPAVNNGVDEYLTFVRVTALGDTISKIEWLYTP